MACFADINVSEGSVATYARCRGSFNIPLTTDLPRNLPVKKIKLVNIWQNYCHESVAHFFDPPCICQVPSLYSHCWNCQNCHITLHESDDFTVHTAPFTPEFNKNMRRKLRDSLLLYVHFVPVPRNRVCLKSDMTPIPIAFIAKHQLSGLQASPVVQGWTPACHQQRASHQIVHILFLANDRCLRDYDLVVAHCWWLL